MPEALLPPEPRLTEAGGGKQGRNVPEGSACGFPGPLLSIVPSSNDFCQLPAFRMYPQGEVQAGSS